MGQAAPSRLALESRLEKKGRPVAFEPTRGMVLGREKGRKKKRTVVRFAKRRPAGQHPLLQLLLAQEWQRVLARIQLYPEELRQYMPLQLVRHPATCWIHALPLHVACALDPPLTVVQVMLQHAPDTASWTLQVNGPKKKNRTKLLKKAWKRILPSFRRKPSPLMAEPASRNDVDEAVEFVDAGEEEQSLLRHPPSIYYSVREQDEGDDDPKNVTSVTDLDETSSIASSSLSSRRSDSSANKVILQLSSSGGLQPLMLSDTESTHTLSASQQQQDPHATSRRADYFCVDWDLRPLWDDADHLLPLHLCCLYQASAPVVQALVDAFPTAVLRDIQGMLPLHWLAAGWALPSLVQAPRPAIPVAALGNGKKRSPLPTLKVLREACPNALRVTSGNHNFTPAGYVEECMEDGSVKEACAAALREASADGDEASGADHGENSSLGSLVFVDSDETSILRFPPAALHNESSTEAASLSLLLSHGEWEAALIAVEDDPLLASKWCYGMDSNSENPHLASTSLMVWKRLPIHLACLYGAPVGLIQLLLESFPEGAATAEPQGDCLPLHLAFQKSPQTTTSTASLPVIRLLLEACPQATKAIDMAGRLPIHTAVVNKASYSVIEALIEDDPDAVTAVDADGKTPLDYAIPIYGREDIVVELLHSIGLFLKEQLGS